MDLILYYVKYMTCISDKQKILAMLQITKICNTANFFKKKHLLQLIYNINNVLWLGTNNDKKKVYIEFALNSDA